MFDPQHLQPYEVEYELNLRGIRNLIKSTREKARILATHMETERAGNRTYPESPWDAEHDIASMRTSLQEVSEIVSNNQRDRITLEQAHSRLTHLECRSRRVRAEDDNYTMQAIEMRADVNAQLDYIRPLLAQARGEDMEDQQQSDEVLVNDLDEQRGGGHAEEVEPEGAQANQPQEPVDFMSRSGSTQMSNTVASEQGQRHIITTAQVHTQPLSSASRSSNGSLNANAAPYAPIARVEDAIVNQGAVPRRMDRAPPVLSNVMVPQAAPVQHISCASTPNHQAAAGQTNFNYDGNASVRDCSPDPEPRRMNCQQVSRPPISGSTATRPILATTSNTNIVRANAIPPDNTTRFAINRQLNVGVGPTCQPPTSREVSERVQEWRRQASALPPTAPARQTQVDVPIQDGYATAPVEYVQANVQAQSGSVRVPAPCVAAPPPRETGSTNTPPSGWNQPNEPLFRSGSQVNQMAIAPPIHYRVDEFDRAMPLPRYDPYTGMPLRLRQQRDMAIHKWPMRFSGDTEPGKGVSVHSFVSQVEMYCRNQGTSEQDLISQIMHLLTGSALTWYETVYQTIHSWEDFVRLLKQKFLPEHYSYLLLNAVENRKQQPGEPVGMFITDVQRRLREIPLPMARDEHYATRLIRRNLLPSFETSLRPFDTTSMVSLETLCKRIEGADGNLSAFLPLASTTATSSERVQSSKTQSSRNPFHRSRSHRIAEVEKATTQSSEGSSIDTDSEKDELPEAAIAEIARRVQRSMSKPRYSSRDKKPNRSDAMEQHMKKATCYNCKETGHYWRDCPKLTYNFCPVCGLKGAKMGDEHACEPPKNGSSGSSHN